MWHDRTPIRFHSGRGSSSCAIASRFFAWPGFPLRAGAKHRARTKVKNHSDTIIIGEGKMMKKTYLLISGATLCCVPLANRSEEHTSELQSLMRISYAVFCLKKKK